jgi:hypothetical protein
MTTTTTKTVESRIPKQKSKANNQQLEAMEDDSDDVHQV